MKLFKLTELKIALIYDKINTWGGAERVLLALHNIFPQAPLYTSVYNSQNAQWVKIFPKLIPSFLQNIPLAKTHIQLYSLLMPIAFESFNFDQYDIVISVTSGEAKGIITKPRTLHLSYILTPTRYLWHDPGYDSYRFNLLNKSIHLFKAPFLHYLRNWDFIAAQRADKIATISKTSQTRIQKYYQRKSTIIYPPVNTNFFKPIINKAIKPPRGWDSSLSKESETNTPGVNGYPKLMKPYFLIVSRLTAYKKVGLAIKTFNQLKQNLIIAGTGPEYKNLKSLAQSNIALLGKITEQKLLKLYQNCQALIMPQEEDFGLVALEAQACGKPVIAFNKGGATETIINHKTGLFFNLQTVSSLTDCLYRFKNHKFTSQDCRQQALKFSLDNFENQMKQWIVAQWQAHQT